MKTALILIDIQNDYFPGGRMVLEGSGEAGLNAGKLLEFSRKNSFPLVHVQHISLRPGATFFLPDTPGAEIHEYVRPLAHETVIRKHYPNSFRETGLLQHLRDDGIERIVFCGMMTHMCVDTTVRAAFDHGFICLVAGDACATRSLAFQGRDVPAEHVQLSFLAALDGIFAKVMGTDEIIDLLAD